MASACGSGTDAGTDDAEPATAGRPVAQEVSSPRENVTSALTSPTHPEFPDPLVNVDEIRSGGPPPDGIPSIDDPRFAAVDEVNFLEDNEPVLALEVDGESRAYPVQILIWHEIVNDTVAGIPVAVTYCPLCNSAIAYDRRLGDRVLELGTSGRLYQSAMVMYDRQTESLWSHFTGVAIVGFLTGEQLQTFPMATVSWATYRDAHPDGLVLTTDTGEVRRYGENPYPGYDDVNNPPFLFDGEADDTFAAKERVIGFERGDTAFALLTSAALGAGVTAVEAADDDPITVWAQPGTVSALEDLTVDGGRDVGATGVFVNDVDGEALTFSPTPAGGFADAETSSTWNILGEATAGPLAGSRLEAITHVDTFWFAWAAFQPETVIVE